VVRMARCSLEFLVVTNVSEELAASIFRGIRGIIFQKTTI
jgi:hypothetical protein